MQPHTDAIQSSLLKLPPGPPLSKLFSPSFFLVGGAIEKRLIDALVGRYGPVFTLNLPTLGPTVLVCDHKLARTIMTCPPGALISGKANAILDFVYGKTSMFLVDGPSHHRLRKLLIPPFRNKDTLSSYSKIIEQVAEQVLDKLPLDKPFALLPELRHGMLDIILRIVFGISDETKLDKFRILMTEILEISASYETGLRFLMKNFGGLRHWRKLNRVLRECDSLIYAEIKHRRNAIMTEDQDDILTLLLGTRTEDGDLLSDIEVRDQLLTLLIAGHETTATTLAWSLERVLKTPEVLSRFIAEIHAGQVDTYAEAIVQETLRLRPPIPFFSREVANAYQLEGWNIPKGTNIIVLSGYIHLSEKIYDSPTTFRPERFLDKRIELGGWVPFGGGLHSCIGNHFASLEVKIFMKVMLRRGVFKVNSMNPEWQMRQLILNLPMRGTRVNLMHRAPYYPHSSSEPAGCPFHAGSEAPSK